MDYKAIINLMKEMNQTELTRLELEEEGIRLCLEKANPYMSCSPTISYPQTIGQTASSATVGVTSQASVSVISEVPQEEAGHKKLVSPMVGTFYSQPSPDKPAFVKVGDKVRKGQTICIIEAMKLMNEIESEHDGEIVKVFVGNEEMVEYGQPLFLMK